MPIENTCNLSTHPDWDTYSESRKEQCNFADEQAKHVAHTTLRMIQTFRVQYFTQHREQKDECYFAQFMLECVVGALQKQI